MAATQRVTSDKKDIPSHYVQLSSYGCNSRSKPATAEYQTLHHAWSARKLSGWKLMSTPSDQRGPIFVDPVEAEQIIASIRVGQDSPSDDDSDDSSSFNAALSIAEMRLTLGRIELILERLAVAAESLATQPHEPAGSWRDMNGEVMN